MHSKSSTPQEAAMKHMLSQADMRTVWSIIAIMSGVMLALSLATTVSEVLARSPHAVDWIAWSVSATIWLSAALYGRSRRYYEAVLRGRVEWYRKSRGERIRAAFAGAGLAFGIFVLIFGGPILLGMVLDPGREWGDYLFGAGPVFPVGTALLIAVSVLLPSAMGRASQDAISIR